MDYNRNLADHISQAYKEMMALVCADRAENIRRQSPYSQLINRHIATCAELRIYVNLGLRETTVTRSVLILDIDPYYCGVSSETNLERMLHGYPPYDSITGSVIDLHHIGQKHTSPFAELPHSIHNAPGTNSTLHRSLTASWRNDPKLVKAYQLEAKRHWAQRGEALRCVLIERPRESTECVLQAANDYNTTNHFIEKGGINYV